MENVVVKTGGTETAPAKFTPIGELEAWGNFAANAGLLPEGTSPYQGMAIIQAGKEMGLQPLQSLRSMNFIRGRLVMSVQLQLALAKNRGVLIDELSEVEGACSVILVRGEERVACTYTRQDAIKARLVKPDGNYDKYQRQMLRWRCIGDALRLIAPDLVMNLLSPEEAASIEEFKPEPISLPNPLKPEMSAKEIASALGAEPSNLPPDEPEASPESKDTGERLISVPQGKRFFAIAKTAGWENDELKGWLKATYGLETSQSIATTAYEQICEAVGNKVTLENYRRKGEMA